MGLRFGEPYRDQLVKEMHQAPLRRRAPARLLKLAELGDLGGAIGASLLVARPAAPPG